MERTIEFVAAQLPFWCDDDTRPLVEAEELLNSQLCKFLEARARSQFPMAFFHHEEHQGKRRRVDISAAPPPEAIEAAIYHKSMYDPFLVFEGKRIPAPSATREREYVTGFAERSGGIQRFKLALHGAAHDTAVMIGYVQANELAHWRATINRWIVNLEISGDDVTCNWTTGDALQALREDSAARTSRCESRHARTAGREADEIRLVHLWVRMTTATRLTSVEPERDARRR